MQTLCNGTEQFPSWQQIRNKFFEKVPIPSNINTKTGDNSPLRLLKIQ